LTAGNGANVLGSARHYGEVLDVLRERVTALHTSYETVDVRAGLPVGYVGKCLCVPPVKFFSAMSLFSVLGALGLTALFLEEPGYQKIVSARPTKQTYIRGAARIKQIDLEYLRRLSSKGGVARAKKLTRKRRQQIARKAIRTRWANRAAGTSPKAKPRARKRATRRRSSEPCAVSRRAPAQ
jgi:hypothetical protein